MPAPRPLTKNQRFGKLLSNGGVSYQLMVFMNGKEGGLKNNHFSSAWWSMNPWP